MLRPRPDLNARLLVELAVALDEAGLQRIDDHRRRLVEAFPRFIHAEAERGELTPGQAASQTKAQPPLLSMSSTAACSATRSGSCQGRITAAVPRSTFGQSAVKYVISWRLSGTNE